MKKNFIVERDYDFYSVQLPWKIAFSKKRGKFILQELEKLHPKLTSSCLIKSWFRLRKKFVQADVAVIERSIANLYRHKFNGKTAYLEGKNKKIRLDDGGRSYVFVCLVLMCTAVLFGLKIVKDVAEQKRKVVAAAEKSLPENKNDAVIPVLLAPSKLVSTVFSSVSKKGGRLTGFSWNKGICTFSITGCNSEDVAEAQYCVVSYKDNKPQFTLTVPVSASEENEAFYSETSSEIRSQKDFILSMDKKNQERKLISEIDEMRMSGKIVPINEVFDKKSSERKAVDYQKSVKYVRDELFKLGVSINREHIDEKNAEFEFLSPDSVLYSALKICGLEAEKTGWKEVSFSIEKSGKKNLVKIKFDRGAEGTDIASSFSPLLLTSQFAWLFKEEEERVSKKTELFPLGRPYNKKTAVPSRAVSEKLGEIRTGKGELIVYYRDEIGKIFSERKEYADAM